jgi:hypothetical protein
LSFVSIEDGFEQLFHRRELERFEQSPHMLPQPFPAAFLIQDSLKQLTR